MNKPKFRSLVIWLLVIIGSLVIGHWSFADDVRIIRIEQKHDRGYDYLDVYTTGWTEARGLLLEDKLYIDFPDTRISKKLEISKRKSKRIKNIEVVQKDEKTARIVVSLKKEEIDYDIVNVFGRDKSVIEVSDRLENIYAYQFAWENRNIKQKGQPLKPIKLEPAAEKDFSLRGKTIVLDPGHGGDDPGAFSLSGVPEKTLTLQTARKAAKLLREAGATVYLTRNEDRRSNLRDVAEFANKTGADILISIHYNSIHTQKVSGTETYYYNPVSQKFAEKMHEAIIRGIRRKDRGLHRTPFYVVKNTDMPSVLLEPVYLTNPEESNLAKSPEFQEELAQDIVKGVKEYFRSKSR